jgi:hypothetical protein
MAQRHAAQNDPEFERFAKGASGEALSRMPAEVVHSQGDIAPPALPDELKIADEELSETGQMLKAAWRMWVEHYNQWNYCRGGFKDAMGKTVQTDHPMMLMHSKILMDLRKAYNDAFQKHQAWLVDNRRLIPVNELHAFRSEFLLPVTSLMRNMPAEAAPMMNPNNQHQAIRGGQEWLQQRFMPAVQRMLDGLAALAPRAAA